MSSPYLPESTQRGSPGTIGTALEVRRGEKAIVRHGVRAAVGLAIEQIDSQCAADATRYCLDEEINLLAYGRARAGNDPMAQALVANKVAGLAERNDRRLNRRYG